MRGDLVTVAVNGDFGQPRPALIIQSDSFAGLATVTVLLVTSAIVDAPLLRITIRPDTMNNLRKTSQIMIDRVMTIKNEKVGIQFGKLDPNTMVEVERHLSIYLGITK